MPAPAIGYAARLSPAVEPARRVTPTSANRSDNEHPADRRILEPRRDVGLSASFAREAYPPEDHRPYGERSSEPAFDDAFSASGVCSAAAAAIARNARDSRRLVAPCERWARTDSRTSLRLAERSPPRLLRGVRPARSSSPAGRRRRVGVASAATKRRRTLPEDAFSIIDLIGRAEMQIPPSDAPCRLDFASRFRRSQDRFPSRFVKSTRSHGPERLPSTSAPRFDARLSPCVLFVAPATLTRFCRRVRASLALFRQDRPPLDVRSSRAATVPVALRSA